MERLWVLNMDDLPHDLSIQHGDCPVRNSSNIIIIIIIWYVYLDGLIDQQTHRGDPWRPFGMRSLADSAVAVLSALHQPRVPQVA